MTKKEKEFKQKPGYGALFRNDYKEEDIHPDYKGSITLDDDLIDAAEADGMLQLSAWKKEGKNGVFLSLTVQEKYKGDKKKKKKKKSKKSDL